MNVFYDEDADPRELSAETVAILGYGIQGRAQALTLRDSGLAVVVGNREDDYRRRAEEDGFVALDIDEACRRGTLVGVLLPDEIQPRIYAERIAPALEPGKALVFAHGFAVRYGLIDPPAGVDLMLLAPRLPGHYLRERFLAGWGIPAYVAVERDASGRAWKRLLALARALGVTRCGAIEASFAQETELDLFSEHFTYPAILRSLELGFEVLVEAGYPPELALMELHGSEELGQVLLAAARQGLVPMLASHASPACQAGIAHYWDESLGEDTEARQRAWRALEEIRNGGFARHLLRESERSYPELAAWRGSRSEALAEAERRLRTMLRPPPR